MITIKKYNCHYNKESKSQQKNKKQKREKICIHINIYNHAETGGQISGNGGQNANQDGVVVRKCGKKNKDTKVKKINFEDDMK